jgi:nucleoside-diphosphate-sugar epimerase
MFLVTGASGHLGANLVRRLLNDGESVRVLVRKGSNNTALDGLNVERVYGDLRHLPSVTDAVRGCERVYHCAAKLSITPGNEREIFDSNVVGTRHLLLAARETGVRRVVVTGSLSAVGNDPGKPCDEGMLFYPFDNHLPYATTKALVEHECLKAVVEGLDVVIATSCAIIGPNDFLPSRMGRLLVDFANGKLRAYVPGGFEFVAARDLVEGHLLAMEKGRTGQKYIFGTEFMTVDDLMAIYEDVTGRSRPRIRFSPAAAEAMAHISTFMLTHFFPSKPQRFTPAAVQFLRMQRRADSSKAKSELGYQPTTIAAAIRDAYECFVRRGVIKPSAKRRVLVSRPGES